jgi:hypothetical protein
MAVVKTSDVELTTWHFMFRPEILRDIIFEKIDNVC